MKQYTIKGEGDARYMIVENNGDRCFISPLFGNWTILPKELIKKEMLIEVRN